VKSFALNDGPWRLERLRQAPDDDLDKPTLTSLLNPLFDPAREAALVTGAGNGIGRAIAHALVGEGMGTVFADVREDLVAAAAPPPSKRERTVMEAVSTRSNFRRSTALGLARIRASSRRYSDCRYSHELRKGRPSPAHNICSTVALAGEDA
jgi:short chain dehydrogenase